MIGQETRKADDVLTDFLLAADRSLEDCAVLTIAVHNYNYVLTGQTTCNEVTELLVRSSKAQASYFAAGVSFAETGTGTVWQQELDLKGKKGLLFGFGNAADSSASEDKDTPAKDRPKRYRPVMDPFAVGVFPEGEISLGHSTMDFVKDAFLDATVISEEYDANGNLIAMFLMTPGEFLQVQVTFSAKHEMQPIEWKWMSGPRQGMKRTVCSKQTIEWKKIGKQWLPTKTKRSVNFGGAEGESVYDHFWNENQEKLEEFFAESNLKESDWRPRFFKLFPEATSFLNARKLLESSPE